MCDRGFLDAAMDDVGKTVVEDGFLDGLEVGQVLGRAERDGVDQSLEVASHLAAQMRFGDGRALRDTALGDHSVARGVAQVHLQLGVLFFVRGSKRVHEGRAQPVLSRGDRHRASLSGAASERDARASA